MEQPLDEGRHTSAWSPPQVDARHLALLGLLAVATVALLLYFGGGPATLATLAQAHWPLLAVGAAVHYGGFALRGHRWRLLLAEQGHRLGYLYTTGVLLAGWFVSALVPGRAGDGFRMLVLRLPPEGRTPVPVSDSLGTIVLERGLDIVAILLLSAGAGWMVLGSRVPGWLLGVYGAAVLMLALLGALIVAMPGLLARWQTDERQADGRARVLQKGLAFALDVAVSLRRLPRSPWRLALIVGESLLIWLCDGLLLWAVSASLGQALPGGAAIFTALTVDIFAAVPVTPGGMGQIETAYAALLALIAQGGMEIAAVVLATRAISYWSFLAVSGAVTLLGGFGRWFSMARLTTVRPG